jgi:hypothetical protein
LWLDQNMIDEIDHRLMGEFKTPADWQKRERELVAKYAPHDWAILEGIVPKRWHDLHAYTSHLEMIHRADVLFITNLPKFDSRKHSRAEDKVEALAGKQPRPRADWEN